MSRLVFAGERGDAGGRMHLLPKRTSLVAETALTLKKWIASGELSGMLPGELRLKDRLGVGRDTLRLALKLIAEDGWVQPAAKGRQRRVRHQHLAARRRVPASRLPVTFLSPFPIVDRIVLLELEDLQKCLAEQGRELRFIAPRIFHLERPERHLKRLVGENPSAAWVLHFVSEAVQRWFEQQGIPAFLYGTPFEGVNLPYVVNDWESAAFHAGVQLARHGHRVVAQLGFEKPMPGMLAISRGLRRALATVTPAGQLLVLKEEHSPQTVVQCLETAFRLARRPTALVFCGSNQLLTCLSWMVSKGIAVPADASLVCIPSDSWFQELQPPVCHYENNPHTFSHLVRQKVMELVETGHVARRSIRVRLEYKAGQSIGPAPPSGGLKINQPTCFVSKQVELASSRAASVG